MGILIEEIMRMLPDSAQALCKHPTAKVMGIKRLNDLGRNADPKFLYVGMDFDLEALQGQNRINLLLYSTETLTLDVAGEDSNIMVVSTREAYNDIIQNLLDLLSVQSSLSDISNDMLTIIRDGGDTKRLMKYAYQHLSNPMMLVDVSFNYIDSVGTDSLAEEDSWNYAIANKVLPSEYIHHVMNSVQDGEKSGYGEEGLRVEKPNEITHAAQYSTKVIRNNTVLGYIKLLEKNKKVTPFDLQVFHLLGRFLAFSNMEERGRVPNTDSLSESFLRSILEQTLSDKNEIQVRQAMFNIKLYEALYVIVIKINGAYTNNDQIYYTLRKIRGFFSGNIVTWFQNSFVVLYDTREANCIREEAWTDRFTQMLKTLKCTANISTPFRYLYDIRNYYRQARFCVELRALFREFGPILRYEDVFEYHMISAY